MSLPTEPEWMFPEGTPDDAVSAMLCLSPMQWALISMSAWSAPERMQ